MSFIPAFIVYGDASPTAQISSTFNLPGSEASKEASTSLLLLVAVAFALYILTKD